MKTKIIDVFVLRAGYTQFMEGLIHHSDSRGSGDGPAGVQILLRNLNLRLNNGLLTVISLYVYVSNDQIVTM